MIARTSRSRPVLFAAIAAILAPAAVTLAACSGGGGAFRSYCAAVSSNGLILRHFLA